MKRVLTEIMFTQQPSQTYPARTATIVFNFVHEFEITSTWRNLADTGKITLPKNVYVLNQNNKPVALLNTNTNMGGFGNGVPVFLRGDKVTIQCGYGYYQNSNDVSAKVTIFDGYISAVTSHKPIELEVMDNMYILQKTQAKVNEWAGYTVEEMLQGMINYAVLPFTVDTTTSTILQNFRTGNETIAKVLARLKTDYNFEAYFRGAELRCGSFEYLPGDAGSPPYPAFTFQQNIISDELNYVRVDDLVISEVASTVSDAETGEKTKDGQAKTKKQQLQVLVTFKDASLSPVYFVPKPGEAIPDNKEGERKQGFFPQAKTIQQLQNLAVKDLLKFYYQGLRGKFTTFGMPFITHGSRINILDPKLPERNGLYMVRGVKYTGGVNGLRQEIELDYLVYRTDANGNEITTV